MPLAFVEKRRVGNESQRMALTLIGSVAGKDVIIVDDMVDTAGSMQQAVESGESPGCDVMSIFLSRTRCFQARRGSVWRRWA